MAFKGALTLAFERALRDSGVPVPPGTKTPMLVTSEWRGPRDR